MSFEEKLRADVEHWREKARELEKRLDIRDNWYQILFGAAVGLGLTATVWLITVL